MEYLPLRTMETFIFFIQWGILLSMAAAMGLLLGALPYAIGRFVGRKEAEGELEALFSQDRSRFQVRVAEIQVRASKKDLEAMGRVARRR